ncbi:cupin domain-containing protein [Diaminobutyricibacter sp. McL0618]|uniref:cupin domain-containing protein n=1 Tax=Leifsonia sp. McL0618 TaxID=3415677 RepID=UPI003CF48C5D
MDALETVGRIGAADLELDLEPVPVGQVVTGAPATGATAFGTFGAHEVGVWEMTPGAMSDVEADELFVVVSGRATVEFVDTGAWMLLGPGDVVQLRAGARTVWTVTETLRKVYLA